tara:strand:- start:775 stop:1527 length:753 start_codon:yes stop_codon:yes gene_type:complete
MKNIGIIILTLLIHINGTGKNIIKDTLNIEKNKYVELRYQSVIIPVALISYGIIGNYNKKIQEINFATKEEINKYIKSSTSLDNHSQYIALLSPYVLNVIGINGKNNFKDKTLTLATAYSIMGISVNILKKRTSINRPDNSSATSFPSGHTATAFMGAEFLYQEYKNQSIWYGISGYIIATFTGILRISNNKHWFNDVVAGTGLGILSTKSAYLLLPIINNKILMRKNNNKFLTTFYNGNEYIAELTISF